MKTLRNDKIHRSRRLTAALLATAMAAATAAGLAPSPVDAGSAESFKRISTFSVYTNNEDAGDETVAEIVDASEDGQTLVYTDSELNQLGFVDIADPGNPQPAGTVALPGEPTSVSVGGDIAYVAVNTSESFTDPSGTLELISLTDRSVLASFDLGGQPDSIKVSPDGAFVAIAIENERDEDLGDGEPPQAPPGLVQILDVAEDPAESSLRSVDLVGVPDLFPEDPEPEFVDVNEDNVAAVTLQENNHMVLIDLETGEVTGDFNLGSVDLRRVDVVEDDLLNFTGRLDDVPREPDAVAWTRNDRLATANEGDLFGGSRDFTIFDSNNGRVVRSGANLFERAGIEAGHYPENRSENKGAEPEGIAYGEYEGGNFLFVSSERGSYVTVHRVNGNGAAGAEFQLLPAGLGPEGIATIPDRNLLVVSSEVDEPPFGVRATITIYEYGEGAEVYPQVTSKNRSRAVQGWGALSGMAASPYNPSAGVAVQDSFYAEGVIHRLSAVNGEGAKIGSNRTVRFPDGTPADVDLEGIDYATGGGYWLASEGAASVDSDDPTDFSSSTNKLLNVRTTGVIRDVVELPEAIVDCRAATVADTEASRGNRRSVRFGFEGVAEGSDGRVYVATQREWIFTTEECAEFSGTEGVTKIWIYDPAGEEWTSVDYELTPKPENASWVGLSEITALDDGTFIVIERDNRTGDFAEVKQLVKIDILGDDDGVISADEKQVFDLLPEARATNGWISDKPEGTFVAARTGAVYVVTDNDGVDDWNGETQWLSPGAVDEIFGDEPLIDEGAGE